MFEAAILELASVLLPTSASARQLYVPGIFSSRMDVTALSPRLMQNLAALVFCSLLYNPPSKRYRLVRTFDTILNSQVGGYRAQ